MAFLSLLGGAGWLSPTQCRIPLTPLLHTYLTLTSLAERSQRGNGVWVSGADSFLGLDNSINFAQSILDDREDADILLFSIPVSAEYAAGKHGHGAYRLDEKAGIWNLIN